MARLVPQAVALFDATPQERALLEEAAGGPVPVRPDPRPGDLAEAEFALVHRFAPVPREVWRDAPRLRWILSLNAGADHVPFQRLPPAARVVSTHGANAAAIAEHAFALLLAAAKRVPFHARALREGRFLQDVPARRLDGSGLLVLGAGAIGSRALALGRAFGMRASLLRRSGRPHPDAERVYAPTSLHEALAEADFVVLALPLKRDTLHLLDAAALARMRADAVLVNVARGRLVAHDALARHLERHPAFTYATDVWWRYPGEDGTFHEPLLARENVIGTPHAAAVVPGWRREMVAMAAKNLRAIAEGGEPPAGSVEDPADYEGLRG